MTHICYQTTEIPTTVRGTSYFGGLNIFCKYFLKKFMVVEKSLKVLHS
jgi:hypothetical protein